MSLNILMVVHVSLWCVFLSIFLDLFPSSCCFSISLLWFLSFISVVLLTCLSDNLDFLLMFKNWIGNSWKHGSCWLCHCRETWTFRWRTSDNRRRVPSLLLPARRQAFQPSPQASRQPQHIAYIVHPSLISAQCPRPSILGPSSPERVRQLPSAVVSQRWLGINQTMSPIEL